MDLVLVRTKPHTIARASPLRRLNVVRIIFIGLHDGVTNRFGPFEFKTNLKRVYAHDKMTTMSERLFTQTTFTRQRSGLVTIGLFFFAALLH